MSNIYHNVLYHPSKEVHISTVPVSQRSLTELQPDLDHVKKMQDVVEADQSNMPTGDFSFTRDLLAQGRQQLEEEMERKASGQP